MAEATKATVFAEPLEVIFKVSIAPVIVVVPAVTLLKVTAKLSAVPVKAAAL